MFELAGFAGGSYHQDATKTGEALVNARLHFSGNRTGAFTGGGIGSTWNVDGWRRLVLGEAGLWARSDLGSAIASVSPISVNDTTRYVDSEVSLATARDRFDFSALAGFRFGSRLPSDLTGAKSWASFTATAWLSERIGVVAAGGTYPVDPTQGFPGGRFVSLSIRLASARRNAASLQNVSVQSAADTDIAPDVDAFRVVRTATGQISFRVHAAAANSVEINGDFTEWVPANLTRSEQGWWTLTLPVSAGTYQMNLRVDGGSWLVPAGLLSIKDEFGGVVGVLVIE
jgi:Carbohydrate-binding module 48 (Isoamylase N-terminal domain)